MDEKCLRCKNKEPSFACMLCDKFKFLCSQCDCYVHSLPSKKNHKRTAINKEIETGKVNYKNN